MADEFKHTDAAEMDTFMAKNQASQLLEIWLNGRETNGSVAEAFDRIDKQGKEIQRIWVSLSHHIEAPHPNVKEFDEIVEQHRDLWSVWRFSRWFIPLSIPVSLATVTAFIEFLKYWR